MATPFYNRTPGIRQDQVKRHGESFAKKVGMFARRVELTAPGDVNVDPKLMLALSGTGTGWDMKYYIMSVTFAFDQPANVSDYGGCTMTIDAQSTADVGGAAASGGAGGLPPTPTQANALPSFGAPSSGVVGDPNTVFGPPTPGVGGFR